ncbi:peptide-methionine (S)-S-oxide reductase MsrA [Parvularcula flava]|uniref:Peptide methionine sulfoxide reductase MsrA n=1 Tax=Aquisalinus luteolus TaxID=1566827 RepID=A0A8J3ERF0_9PROT|nr:peptide-methionine (S)-S-oxide reductase MsrA [Aquisalinus luteolus]NHK28645.1 peptide-methionine (S)-S-oxide reductase MsrA [Aquisalinus luteolus]GGH99098.1 peptide methionine sulfoxide reductase MsrA [Aquisalinus luteolus]
MTDTTEKAILAGGCFWGMQDLLRKVPGVRDTRVGYTGGTVDNPTYDQVKTGRTGHAESIEIAYDPSVVSYEKILEWFFQIHDPTTKDRQGNDRGSQYRSAIFYTDEAQKKIAEDVIDAVESSGKWPGPVVTELVPAPMFWQAEDFHQDYLERYPNGYTCHYVRPDWTLDSAKAS